MWGGGGIVLVLWLTLHNDYKIGLIFKRFLFNEIKCLIKLTIVYTFFFFWDLKLRHFGQ